MTPRAKLLFPGSPIARVRIAMSVTDELLTANQAYAATYSEGALPMPPAATWPWWPAWTPAGDGHPAHLLHGILWRRRDQRPPLHGSRQGQPVPPHKNVRGFVFDVATDKLDEVT